jgi:hypothetical protein
MLALDLRESLEKIDELSINEIKSYSYSEASMVKVFVYALIKGIYEFKTLQDHLTEKREIQSWLGWHSIPHRTTLSRCFKAMPTLLGVLIGEVYQKFVSTEKIQEEVMSVDSSLMQAQGNVWHKKDREAGILPRGCYELLATSFT